jgi:hypothetical protein
MKNHTHVEYMEGESKRKGKEKKYSIWGKYENKCEGKPF